MIVVDLTLHGYTRAWEHNIKDADELVKWICAPSVEAVQKFVDKNGLKLDSPLRDMKRDALSFKDGIDLILNEDGEVMDTQNYAWKQDWEAEMSFVAQELEAVS